MYVTFFITLNQDLNWQYNLQPENLNIEIIIFFHYFHYHMIFPTQKLLQHAPTPPIFVQHTIDIYITCLGWSVCLA